MRPNGFHLVLATLLVPATAWAQDTNGGEPPPVAGEAAGVPTAVPAEAPIAADEAGTAGAAADAAATAGGAAATAAPDPAAAGGAAPEPVADAASGADEEPDADGAAEDADPTDPSAGSGPAADTAGIDGGDAPDGAAPDAAGSVPGVDVAGDDAVADTEAAFADIYGGEPGQSEAGTPAGAYDPWERYNRRMHRFNNAVDRTVARPLARGYVKVVPRPVRLGVTNFFNNLAQPLTMVNSLLQGKPKQAGQVLGRFLLNSTFGIGGIFDPASRANLPQRGEDFGQTLGVWGWRRSRYVELPLFGPRTVRDVFGMAGDAPLSPLRRVEADRVRVPLQGLQLVDIRARLLSTDSLREGAEDDYALVRDAWSQRRDYQIFGDRLGGDEGLPEYLREDGGDRTVPVDAMPLDVPGEG